MIVRVIPTSLLMHDVVKDTNENNSSALYGYVKK